MRGSTIERISADPIPVSRTSALVVIDGAGRTLMPGLIDARWHAMLVRPTPVTALSADIGYLNLIAGAEAIADSPDQVRVRVREQFLLGASQIKLTGGGGIASPHTPLDVSTFTEAELHAAVEAAENWGTYVTVHAYTPGSIQRAIAAGVKCIEHGHLMDEATARLIAEKGIWLSTQPFPKDIADVFPVGSAERAKAMEVVAGTDRTYELAKKYKIKTAFGTDILFSRELAQQQGGHHEGWPPEDL